MSKIIKVSTTLLLTIYIANIILPTQSTSQPKLSKQSLKLTYRAINISLHTSNQIWAQPMVPTVHRHHIHSRKHDGQAQVNYLNAFINLFGH